MSSKLKVVVFSGGRGTASICDAFKRHPQIDLTVLVNTYDDGLSTGQLRRLIPGMLGPSDVRKNISYFIPSRDRADRALQQIVEYRLPRATTREHALCLLEQFASGNDPVGDDFLSAAFRSLRLYQSRTLAGYLQTFLGYYRSQPEQRQLGLEFADCSVGNLLFAGCYLSQQQDFNAAVAAFAAACEITATIHNVTDGRNAVLVGLKSDGVFLADEASIVSPQNKSRVSELFLLPDYLSAEEAAWVSGATFENARSYLSARELFPPINPAVRHALSQADLIIYGPGTQHSSLLPSYLTQSIGAEIARNRGAEKIFISNIATDYEIQGETANTLVTKVLHHLNAKGREQFSPTDLITTALLQTGNQQGEANQQGESIACDLTAEPFKTIGTVLTDWHGGSGKHAGSRILEELTKIVNRRSRRRIGRHPYMVSIIVPGLNEERTLRDVLLALGKMEYPGCDLKREIIYVDGGSTDDSLAIARSVPGVRVFQVKGAPGRGAALRLGIEQAIGNVIAFFPADGEYDVRDLGRAIEAVVNSGERIVFGSRTVKCLNLNRVIGTIYRGNYIGYLLSKYGGMLVSLSSLLLHNRFISDAFTGIKVFDAATLRGFGLVSRGLDLETEVLAKAFLAKVFILELPVRFAPRTRKQGKKTTIFGGFGAVWSLLWWGTLRPLFGGAAPAPEESDEEIPTWPIYDQAKDSDHIRSAA